jgi:hypothetical protein
MNSLFGTCAWNGSAADRTNVIGSFAAKVRTFHFPLDMQNKEHKIARAPKQGEAAIQHVETMFPLWFRQKDYVSPLVQTKRVAQTVELRTKKETQRNG